MSKTTTAEAGAGGIAVATVDSPDTNTNITVDNRRKFVINNVHNAFPQSQGAGKPGTSNDEAWGFVLLGALAVGLFATHFDVVLWFAIGAVIGLFTTAALGARRARQLRLWDKSKDALIVFEVVLTVIVTVWAWVSVLTSTHKGSSLEALRVRVEAGAAAMPLQSGGFQRWLGTVLNPIVAFFKVSSAEGQLVFAISLTFAVFISFMLLCVAWLRLNDWYSYMGFFFKEGNERAGKRATRYIERRFSDVWGFVILAALAVFFASGLFPQLMDASFSGAISPFPIRTS